MVDGDSSIGLGRDKGDNGILIEYGEKLEDSFAKRPLQTLFLDRR
jgi:hypothetical protein